MQTFSIKHWLRIRDSNKRYLFYGPTLERLSYSTAWGVMRRTLECAGLVHKKYSLHCLRHTFATDMINAGMRIEVLQQLLGHKSIELTMRYAKLSAKTREQDYFRAMQIIEHGGNCEAPILSDIKATDGLFFIKVGTLDDSSWVVPGAEIWWQIFQRFASHSLLSATAVCG